MNKQERKDFFIGSLMLVLLLICIIAGIITGLSSGKSYNEFKDLGRVFCKSQGYNEFEAWESFCFDEYKNNILYIDYIEKNGKKIFYKVPCNCGGGKWDFGWCWVRKKMSYELNHTENHCDKCNKKVGKQNLYKLPFIYKDMNDKSHEDLGKGYRQYYVCEDCKEKH